MADNDAPIAFVTGGSRGIGRATALALADAGYDVAIAARTVHEGDGRMTPGSVRDPQEVAVVAGSLESTAAAIETTGRRALPVAMDLLDRPSIDAAVATVLDEWGRIDAVVNNAIYQGPGRMDRVLDLDLDDATKLVVGNYVHQLHLIQLVVPGMLERGGGFTTNDKPSDATFSARFRGAPPEVAAAVIAWLCSSPDSLEHAGTLVFSQSLCKRMQLLEGWPS